MTDAKQTEERAPAVIVTSLLNTLALRYNQRQMATVGIDDEIAVLQKRRAELTAPLDSEIADIESRVKLHVLALGVTIKAGDYMAVYTKGRDSVDVKLFRGMILAHPEYAPMLQIGQPSVSIRPARRESDA
jgi:hypothetical protein